MRAAIWQMISAVTPLDETEANHIRFALDWIDSGADLFRVSKPATPNPHLVSYFLLVDGNHVLLVDHINAELWLPTGGHVELDENPCDTVVRELREELDVSAEFIGETPLFVTVSETVGRSSGHTDVSLWFALKGQVNQNYTYDTSEFHSVRWFHHSDIPFERADPNLGRFLKKLYH
ncbi:NUDIX domain-containing protein [Ruegeria atlantica]|uniref:NUDIX domain-containing protein n=1 Tax=Ruegeria atlantica TaxID=81569 RepID=UPI0014805473|nr:NUDIX domain-containing protein [Ruegeria atlantica]